MDIYNNSNVEINDITNTILLVSPGGNVNIDEFKSRNGISHDLVLATYMTPLLINNSVSDKLGHLLELDENDNVIHQTDNTKRNELRRRKK
jgi:hypothetical protein